jgi:L-asparagine transporter-like permease
MNAVVLTAVLSCLNSGLYTASRMLFVLDARNEAPEMLVRINRRRRPRERDPVLVDHRLHMRHRRCLL